MTHSTSGGKDLCNQTQHDLCKQINEIKKERMQTSNPIPDRRMKLSD